MVFPSFSGRLASSIAAKAAAPEEITDKNPFTLADELSGCKCIFVGNGDNLIVDFRVQHIGDKACADALNLMRSCNAGREHCGSSRLNSNDLNRRVLDFRYSPTPVIVPPVPTPATKISTFPSVAPLPTCIRFLPNTFQYASFRCIYHSVLREEHR